MTTRGNQAEGLVDGREDVIVAPSGGAEGEAPNCSWICARCRQCFGEEPSSCAHDSCKAIENLRGLRIGDDVVLERPVGVGGMGAAVWRARHERLGRSLAVKLLPAGDDEAGRRFEEEARVGGALDHPNLVKVHGAGRLADGRRYIAMDLVEGTSLTRLLRDEGPLPTERAVRIVEQVLSALAHAHDEGVIHRDIKLNNVIVSEDGADRVTIIDYGISERFRTHRVTVGPSADGNLICGTMTYMPPELLMGYRASPAADIYAAGVVLYVLLSGATPYEAKTGKRLAFHILSRAPLPLTRANPDVSVPSAVEAVLQRALAKRPQDRFGDAEEMREALLAATRGATGLIARPPDAAASRRGPTAVNAPTDPYAGTVMSTRRRIPPVTNPWLLGAAAALAAAAATVIALLLGS